MALTRAEALAAAERADEYPPGYGCTFIVGLPIGCPEDAACLLAEDPSRLAEG